MSDRCRATTNAGERCKAVAMTDGLCALHADPERAVKMGRMSGQARRSKHPDPQPELEMTPPQSAQEVRNALGQFMADVRAGRLDPKVASTLGYLASVLLKSIEVADVEERLAALEKVVGTGQPKNQEWN